jgi:hypothetical protein
MIVRLDVFHARGVKPVAALGDINLTIQPERIETDDTLAVAHDVIRMEHHPLDLLVRIFFDFIEDVHDHVPNQRLEMTLARSIRLDMTQHLE